MKTKLKIKALFAALMLMGITMFAQVPEGVNYQAVVRDGSGNVMANANLIITVGIYDGPSSSGTLVYEESFVKTSSAYGTINFVIGTGVVNSGDFTTIDWLNGDYYAKIDADDGNGTVTISETKLQSVPYALAAKKAASAVVADSLENPKWSENTTSLFTTSKTVGVGVTPSNDFRLQVQGGSSDSAGIYSYSNIGVLGASQHGPTLGALGVQGTNDMFGISTLDRSGNEIGIMGISAGSSNSDNYGVFGYSNGIAGYFEHTSGNTVSLGTSTRAGVFNGPVEVQVITSTPAPNTIYGNTMPLAYGETLVGSSNYGVASITYTGTGEYTITLTNSWSGAGAPIVIATSYNSTAVGETIIYDYTGTNTIYVRIVDSNGNPRDSAFSFIVFGTPQ